MFSQFYPVLMSTGVLPVTYDDLVIENVFFDEAVSANYICQFDMGLVAAETLKVSPQESSPAGDGSKVSASAWGRCRVVDVSEQYKPYTAYCKYGHVTTAVAQYGRGKVRVIGKCNVITTADAAYAKGQPMLLSVADVGKVCPVPDAVASAGNFVTTAHLRPIVAICLTATTGSDTDYTMDAFFNGLVFGYHPCNGAFNDDTP